MIQFGMNINRYGSDKDQLRAKTNVINTFTVLFPVTLPNRFPVSIIRANVSVYLKMNVSIKIIVNIAR